ncbi:MAG: HAD family hydrolase [Candidatus Acetothermia bacterium]
MDTINALCEVLRSVDGIHFDMDGSLVNSETAWYNSEMELLRDYGVTLPREDIRAITQTELVGRGQKFAARFYKEKFNLSAPVNEILRRRVGLVKQYYGSAPLMAGAEEMLDAVNDKGYRITLATSAPLDLARIFIEKHGFEGIFDAVVTDDHTERSKPYPDIFLKAAEDVGVSPKRSLVVEDSKNGLLAAKEAGMYCLLIPNSQLSNLTGSILDEADVVLESLDQLDFVELEMCLT